MNALLLAQDETELHALVNKTLVERGYFIVSCQTAKEAYEESKRTSFALWLVDLEQLQLAGFISLVETPTLSAAPTLFRQLRQLPGGEDIHIILLLERDHLDQLRLLAEAGASDFLFKPVEPAVLVSKLIMIEQAQKRVACIRRLSTAPALESDFRSIVEHIEDLVVIAKRGKTYYRNPGWAKILGYHPEETADRRYFDFLAPEHLARLHEIYQRCARHYNDDDSPQEWCENFEVDVLTRDERRLTMDIKAHPISFRGEQAVLLVGRDISARKQAEHALRDSEARYRIVSELTSDLTFSIGVGPDHALHLEWSTHGSSDITEAEIAELMHGGKWKEKIHPQDVQRMEDSLVKILAGQTVEEEYRICRGKDSVRWVHQYAKPIFDEQGERVIRFIGALQDITERKEIAEALERRNAELQLANEQLGKLHRAKDELTAMISHELRTPLVTGLGYIELLLSGGFGPISTKVVARMTIAYRNLQRLAGLIDAMLEYRSFLDQTFINNPKLTTFDLVSLTRECVAEFLVRSGVLAQHVQLVAPLVSTKVISDLDLVQMALANVLNNVAKHAGEQAKITIEVHTAQDGLVQVTVSDDGAGIPPELLDRVFEPFTKRTNATEGYGLGLAIVDAICQSLQIKIELQSSEGMGTTLSFWLKAAAST